MRDHDPVTHEEQIRLAENAKERMTACLLASLENKVVKDAIMRDIPPEVEHKKAS